MPLTLEDVARYPRPGTATPDRIRFTPDGTGVSYLLSPDGSLVRSLWRHDLGTGERALLMGANGTGTGDVLDRDEELRRERLRLRELGVTDYAWSERAAPAVLLVPSAAGVVIAGPEGPRVVRGTEGAVDPQLSPDARRLAFVRDGDLYVVAVPDGEPRRLTEDAEDGVTNGLAEYIAQEELDRDRGHWWSPDGERIAFVRADTRHIPIYPIVHQGRETVEVEEHRYPFAGAPNALVRLAIVEVQGGRTTWLDLGPDPDVYLARVSWRPDGRLAAQLLSRDQRSARWLEFTQDGTARLLWEERGDPWLNLEDGPRFLANGEALHTTEASGFRHLLLRDADGRELRQLTDGPWVVTRIAGVDEVRRLAFFVATREGPLERHLYQVPLDGGDVRRLTEQPGWHDVEVDAGRGRFVDRHSSRERPPRVTVRDEEGRELALLHEATVTPQAIGVSPPEPIAVTAADSSVLHGAIYRPGRSSPPWPLVVAIYGGPHAQMVTDSWAMTVDLRAQYLAQCGFLVLKLDNRGSANRGLAFEASIAERMGSVEIEDQTVAVEWLISEGLADRQRIGMYGWSGGGYMTLMAMARRPDVYRVGVAGAPVTDWDGYDTAYTERYMRTPQANPDGYRESAVLSHVDQLSGELLLVHGLIDENVHFRHTARLVSALNRAQKRFELLVLPEERHMPRGARDLEYLERRIADHFRRYLVPEAAAPA